MGGVEEKRYWVNGKAGPALVDSHVQPFTIGGHAVRFRVLSESQFQFKIFLENKQNIVLRSVKQFMKVDLQNHLDDTFKKSRGLLGTYEDGLMLARDAETVFEDPIAFGKNWQVQADEPMLFHNVDGVQAPEQCQMPDAAQSSRRLGEMTMTRARAMKACRGADASDKENCISDVMATGDVDMAGAY